MGETDLKILLGQMNAELGAETYAFCVLDQSEQMKFSSDAICLFREQEGMTAIIPLSLAKQNKLRWEYPWRKITLQVHSSLNAVGFLAAITSKLAQHSISVNPVSGFYHDHLFVPEKQAALALEILQS